MLVPTNPFVHLRVRAGWIGIVALAILIALVPSLTQADHESTTVLTFRPIDRQDTSGATGSGTVDYRGGGEPNSRWTSMFEFQKLLPSTGYTVVIQGRFGEDGSPEASSFTSICDFTTDEVGAGGCWFYFVGLKRLGVAQLRLGDAGGMPVLQATKKDGPGSMERIPNPYSPPENATPPAATPAS